MGQTVTANTPASWHPAETFHNRCQIKEQHALLPFEAAAIQKPQDVDMKSAGDKQAVRTSLLFSWAQ